MWTGQGWVVGLGPRRIIGTKKIAVIVQNYHPEPCYFDDDAIVWLDNVISPLIV